MPAQTFIALIMAGEHLSEQEHVETLPNALKMLGSRDEDVCCPGSSALV